MKKSNKKGFTIVELVIVIAVIGILASVLIPTFASVIDKANASKALQAAKNEYTLYVAEHAKELTGTEDLVIVVGEYYVLVTDGQLAASATKGTATHAAEDLSAGLADGSTTVAIYSAS